MANTATAIVTDLAGGQEWSECARPVVRRTGGVDHVYYFYVEVTTDNLCYIKHNGTSWQTRVIYDSSTAWQRCAVWFDQWTPDEDGTGGTVIHVVAEDGTNDQVYYFGLDTATDTAVTYDGTRIDTSASTERLLVNYGGLSICKATDGDIYVSWTFGSTNVGHYIYSSPTGQTWTSKYDRTEWTVDSNAETDFGVLMPLAGDDVLFIFQSDVQNTMRSVRWDDSASTWIQETELSTDITRSLTNPARAVFSAACQKTSGDVLLTYCEGAVNVAGRNIKCRLYDASGTGTWGAELRTGVWGAHEDGGEPASCSVVSDDTTGAWVLFTGWARHQQGGGWITAQVSQDGDVWGQPEVVSPVLMDPQCIWAPVRIVDDDTALHFGWVDEADLDLEVIDGGFPLNRVTGIARNNAETGIDGAEIDCFAVFDEAEGGEFWRRKLSYQGRQITDGSGNYTALVFDPIGASPGFIAIMEGGTSRSDAGREVAWT